VLALALLPLTVTAGAAGVAEARVVRHRVEAAADLAALAGAGPGAGSCGLPATVAAANGARLLSCSVTDGVVTVLVATTVALPFGAAGQAQARARAGPGQVPPPAPSPLPALAQRIRSEEVTIRPVTSGGSPALP
jgi:secretion/DNA translocation related TadE-like protein